MVVLHTIYISHKAFLSNEQLSGHGAIIYHRFIEIDSVSSNWFLVAVNIEYWEWRPKCFLHVCACGH